MFENVDEGHLDGETPVKYYYNREERIARAPQIVKDFYAGKMKPVRGLRIFYANKSNLAILLGLVIFVASTWIYTAFNNMRNYVKINDTTFEMQAFSYGEEIYASIKIYRIAEEALTAPEKVLATLYFINNDNQLVQKEELSLLYAGGEEYLRTKITDYDIIRVDVIIEYVGEEKELSASVKK